MRKKILEISILASFLAICLFTNRNASAEVKASNKAEIIDTIDVETCKVLTSSELFADQDEIRNEIMYGELEELALLVQAEAGNQDDLGKRLVADTVLNRVDDPDFPDTIHEVIFQDNPIQYYVTYDGAMGKAGYSITEDVFELVLEEYESRTNNDVIYFKTGGYHECGHSAFQYGDHYFNTK